ncbi:MAG: phosphate-starvation-inducible PsiE family protein [Dehalococcoidia bacterium]
MFINWERFVGNVREQGIRRIVAIFLIVMLSVLIVSSVPGLVMVFREELLAEPRWVMDTHKIPIVLDLVLWILIAIELMDSIRIYIARHILHLETVISLAMIALARKIITLKLSAYEPVTILGVAALVVGTALAYYFVRKSHKEHGMQGVHGLEDED